VNVVAKGRRRQRLSTRLAVPPVASARGEIGIPREPTSNTPKHAVPALDLRREPSLNGTRPDGWPALTGRPTLPQVCAAGHDFRRAWGAAARWSRRGRRYFSGRGARQDRSAWRARQSSALAPGAAEPEARGVSPGSGGSERREAAGAFRPCRQAGSDAEAEAGECGSTTRARGCRAAGGVERPAEPRLPHRRQGRRARAEDGRRHPASDPRSLI
jgi:hypothetical protein